MTWRGLGREGGVAAELILEWGIAAFGTDSISRFKFFFRATRADYDRSTVHDSGEQGRDGDATIGRVEMQFVAVPTHFVALCMALGAAITLRRNVGHYQGQGRLTFAL